MTFALKTLGNKGAGWIFWVAGIGVAAAIGWAAGKLGLTRPGSAPQVGLESRSADPLSTPISRGEMLFIQYCASCHGPEGRGDGPSAAGLRPPPRDFALRPWRFAVTPESVRTVIREGIPGTPMPAAHSALSTNEIEELTEYVLRLAEARSPAGILADDLGNLLRNAGFIDRRGRLPSLVLSDAAGKEIRLSEYHGKLLLIHFWGMNCAHCLKEMPLLRTLDAELAPRGGTVLHVCVDAEDAREAQAVADRVAPGLRIFVEGAGLGPAAFETQTLPTTWLVGSDGMAIGSTVGAKDWNSAELKKLLDRLLPLPAGP